MKAPKKNERIEIQEIHMNEVRFNVLGETPFIMHRFSQKAWRELLMPSASANRAELEQRLKHDPFAEYRGAFYRNRDPESPTMFHCPNGMFHAALSSAALDIPGAAKAKIERLTRVVDVNIELYGIPQIFCAMVRNSDINHTPDVRTRPIFPEWGCCITVRYMKNTLSERTVANLISAGGKIVGIGDWRPQKGGPYGCYEIVGDNDKRFKTLVKQQGHRQQKLAYEHPAYFDEDTEELLTWFSEEVQRREKDGLLMKMDDHLEQEGGRRVILERGKKGNADGGNEYLGVQE
jgi:hypothetical protein